MNSLHHLGIAVRDIETGIKEAKNYFQISEVGSIVYDPIQKVTLCLITLQDGTRIELVAGEVVHSFLKETHQLFHHCYEVDNIQQSLADLTQKGAKILLPPKPAILFNHRKACFLSTPFGIIELLEKEALPLESLYFLGNQSLDPLIQSIKNYAAATQFPLQISAAPYNHLLIETMNPSSQLYQHAGMVFALLGFEDILHYSDQADLLEQTIQELITAWQHGQFKAKQFFLLLMPYDPAQASLYQRQILALQTICSAQRIHWVDLNHYCPHDYASLRDVKANEMAHIPYISSFYPWLADHILRRVHAKLRRPYKLIAVDCDHTLWAGVCAEDPIEQLVVHGRHAALQKKLVELSQQGVVIALLSKNIPEDVWHVFEHCPQMILQKEHVLAWEINWKPKADNILQLCEQYQIASSSVVFIDDNLTEIAAMQEALPEVLAIHFSEQQDTVIENAWYFDKFDHTQADEMRREFYRAESQRTLMKASTQDFAAFIDSLQLKVQYDPVTADVYARIEQMLARVTQFNTTHLAFHQIPAELFAQGYHACISVTDRFGDYGEVGFILSVKEKGILKIVSIVLSCRVLGRGVEESIVATLRDYARTQQLSAIHIQYRDNPRNQPAKLFIEHSNPCSSYPDQDTTWYVYDLESFQYSRRSGASLAPVQRYADAKQTNLNQIILNVIQNQMRSVPLPVAAEPLEFEQQLLKKVSELCGAIVPDLNANFVQLGGDSIQATYLASWLFEQFQVNVDMLTILKSPSLQALTQSIDLVEKNSLPDAHLPSAPALPIQKWLYLIDQLKGVSWFYNMPFIFRIKGPLDKQRLITSFQSLVSKHVAFHTEFFEEAGKLCMRRIPPELVCIEVNGSDFTDDMLRDLYTAETQNPFHLQRGPLIRFILIQRSETEHFLMTNKHHSISDGWSDQILFQDIAQAYSQDGKLSAWEGPDFYDYAHWNALQDQADPSTLAKYKEYIGQIEGMALPFLTQPHRVSEHHGEYHGFSLSRRQTQAIMHIAKTMNVTPYIVFLCLFHHALQELTRQERQHILTPINGRAHPGSLGMIGCFVNLLVVTLTLSARDGWRQALQKTADAFADAYSFAQIPFSDVIQALSYHKAHMETGALQTMFSMQNTNIGCLTLPGLEIEFFCRGYPAARVALILELELYHDTYIGGFYYNPALLSGETIQDLQTRLMQHIEDLRLAQHAPEEEIYG